ncbi:MAG: hypothetical protein PWQ52_933 [Methanolobus sp.]|nr:hypothetical protein [Methanolobus sp.]
MVKTPLFQVEHYGEFRKRKKTTSRDKKGSVRNKTEGKLIDINVSYGIKPLCFNWSFYKEERPHDFKWKPKKSCKQLFNI